MLFWMYMALTFDNMIVTVKVSWIFVQNYTFALVIFCFEGQYLSFSSKRDKNFEDNPKCSNIYIWQKILLELFALSR